MKTITISSADAYAAIDVIVEPQDGLDTSDLDVTADLRVTKWPNLPASSDETPPRAMQIYAGVATYLTSPEEFEPGNYYGQVRLTLGSVIVNTEIFRLVVHAAI